MPDQPSPEYKALQRKLNQSNKRAIDADRRGKRMEQDMIGLLTLFSSAVPDMAPKVQEYMVERKRQEEFDNASGSMSDRLAEWTEDLETSQAEEIESLMSTADVSNYSERHDEALRKAMDFRSQAAKTAPADPDAEPSVGEGNESRTYSHDEVQRLLQGQQREAGRVDTSVGSGAPDNGVTQQSIQGVLERKSSPSDMKSMLDKALDQLTN